MAINIGTAAFRIALRSFVLLMHLLDFLLFSNLAPRGSLTQAAPRAAEVKRYTLKL